MKRFFLVAFVAAEFFSSSAYSGIQEILPKNFIENQAEVNVYFTSGVNRNSISDLMVAMDRIRIQHPNIEKVNLLINSPGGSIYAGMQAFWNLKSYPIPIHAINVGNVSSAATFLFCAADERSSVPSGSFLLHPAERPLSGHTKPDVIERQREYLQSDNAFIENIYRSCTNMNHNDIKDMLKSEYNSKFLDSKQAEKIALTNNTIDKIPQSAASVFIQEKGE